MRGGPEEDWEDNEFEGWRLILVIAAIFIIPIILTNL